LIFEELEEAVFETEGKILGDNARGPQRKYLTEVI